MLAVLTHEDVPDVLYGGAVKDRRLFTRDTVRFEADILAGVAALTPELAEEAARLIEVEYELLPITDIEAALAPDAPLVHEPWESYEARRSWAAAGTCSASRRSSGATPTRPLPPPTSSCRPVTDASQGVRSSRARHRSVAGRPGHRMDVDPGAVRRPQRSRTRARIPESKVRIIVPLLGGGFGAKCDFHFEGHVAALARAAGRPVKLVFSRREEFVAPAHRREGMVIELETGARRDGTLVARRGRLVLDGGAYCGEGGSFAQMSAMHMRPLRAGERERRVDARLYQQPALELDSRSDGAPGLLGARAAHGRARRALGLDPVELRRRTLIEDGSQGPASQILESIAIRRPWSAPSS